VPSNWKVMLETFKEGYHVPVTHPTIMDRALQSVLNVVTPIGLHGRMFGFVGKDADGSYDVIELARRIGVPESLPTTMAMGTTDPAKATANALIYLATCGEAVRSVRIPPEGLKRWGPQEMADIHRVVRDYWASKGVDLSGVSDMALSGAGGGGMFTVFPNTILFRGAAGNAIVRVRPNRDDHTTSLLEFSWLTPVPNGQKPLRDAPLHLLGPGETFANYEHSTGYLGFIFDQDVSNCRKVQKGMEARAHSRDPNANKVLAGKSQEYNIVGFHRNLHAWLDRH
jgi:phenylpropionate dioxygenase-like ring-hydroxylating dioxygenase large terminal subunit